MKKMILSAIMISALIVSCKKEKCMPPTCNINMVSIAGSYKTIAIKYKTNSTSVEQDLFALAKQCEKDDIIKVNADGTANFIDAGTICTPNGSYNGTWSLVGQTITIDGTPGTIQSFDCKKLIVTGTGTVVPGDNLTVTYEKQ